MFEKVEEVKAKVESLNKKIERIEALTAYKNEVKYSIYKENVNELLVSIEEALNAFDLVLDSVIEHYEGLEEVKGFDSQFLEEEYNAFVKSTTTKIKAANKELKLAVSE